jgi:PAS domain S-box-containing protein
MAITQIEPPFAIVDVNKAWCQLCGYTREEAVGSTLKELLQGPETNRNVAKELLSSLLEEGSDEEPEAVLVNYRSDGRKFRNHVRAGKIKTGARTTHFVGVFRKLSEDNGMNIISDEDLYANV